MKKLFCHTMMLFCISFSWRLLSMDVVIDTSRSQYEDQLSRAFRGEMDVLSARALAQAFFVNARQNRSWMQGERRSI